MALKAGRVGVAPDQVDEFGRISSEATSGYTKQEADAKFETQTHAASTYETKSEAAALQPILLSVPIEMLEGTALTVESALQMLSEVSTGELTTDFTKDTARTNAATRDGNVVTVDVNITGITFESSGGTIAMIPEGFRPDRNFIIPVVISGQYGFVNVWHTGAITYNTALTNATVRASFTYVTAKEE